MAERLHTVRGGWSNGTARCRLDPAAALELAKFGEGILVEGNGLRKDAVLSVESVGEACVVKLGGELDIYNAPQVRDALIQACADMPRRIVVDLSEVEFIDSTALGVLIEARGRVGNGRAFLLAGPGLETRRTLEISGLDRHFSVHDSVSEALVAKI